MKSGFRVDSGSFDKATRRLVEGTRRNTLNFGKTIARQFREDARKEAPWTDHRGAARRGFAGDAELHGSVVKVTVGAKAPNYKRRARSSPDYMEYLEFAHEKKYAIVYPMVESMRNDIIRRFGMAALKGRYQVRILRDKMALRKRKARYRAAGKKQP